MAKKKKVKKKATRLATFGMASIISITIVLITLLSVIIEIVDKYKEKKNLEQELITLKEDYKKDENMVNKLKDKEYLARYAREKYFYSKDGELIIRIPEDDEE